MLQGLKHQPESCCTEDVPVHAGEVIQLTDQVQHFFHGGVVKINWLEPE